MSNRRDGEGGIPHANPTATVLHDDGTYPNNETLPLLFYRGALEFADGDPAAQVERTFHSNGWGRSWRNSIYDFHHYHSTAHEALGCYSGSATVQLGGESGLTIEVTRGDAVVIPAGVAHRNLRHSADFRVVGAYPEGTGPDMNYGKEGERPAADERIAALALPEADPVYGSDGPLTKHWAHKAA